MLPVIDCLIERPTLSTCIHAPPPSAAGVSAVVCDALDLKGVEAVLDGCDAAITTLGGAPEGDEDKRVDYAGNRNVIESAGILGVTRVVMVTSVGCGSSREAISDKVYEVSWKLDLNIVHAVSCDFVPRTTEQTPVSCETVFGNAHPHTVVVHPPSHPHSYCCGTRRSSRRR